MDRLALETLIKWKNNQKRKPLIVTGARRVGKTWLLQEFARLEYKQVVYFNFDKDPILKEIFNQDFNLTRIVESLSIASGTNILEPEILIIFDEIQEVPAALTALKYFCEEMPNLHIVAGSLLGLSLHEGTGFPVGKVQFLNLYPMSFLEFLKALGGECEQLLKLILNDDFKLQAVFKERLIHFLRLYYFIGGMPECVQTYIDTQDFNEVREVQLRLLTAYEFDFSRHVEPYQVRRVRLLWDNIPALLTHENKKCVFSHIKEGSRAKDFEIALQWLLDAGLIYKVTRAEPKLPLKAYEDNKAFKLFYFDVGLLGAKLGISARSLIENLKLFQEYNGALTEQYVLGELKGQGQALIYYWSNARSEIDFML